jgi:hypothetical protein
MKIGWFDGLNCWNPNKSVITILKCPCIRARVGGVEDGVTSKCFRVLSDAISNEKIRCQEKLFDRKGFRWVGL